VIHACKLVQDMQEIDKKFKDSLSAIQADLRKR